MAVRNATANRVHRWGFGGGGASFFSPAPPIPVSGLTGRFKDRYPDPPREIPERVVDFEF